MLLLYGILKLLIEERLNLVPLLRNERSGRWVHVRTEDGVDGWIHDSLVTGVPAEALE